jgi:hypothetical protein
VQMRQPVDGSRALEALPFTGEKTLPMTLPLMSAGFRDTVDSVLSSAAINPHLLTLEVTERLFVRDGQRAPGVLNSPADESQRRLPAAMQPGDEPR